MPSLTHLLARYGNRHGLVAGATGTGKTVSLLVLNIAFKLAAETFVANPNLDVAKVISQLGVGEALVSALTAKPADRGRLGELLWGTKRRQGMVETLAKQAARTAGSRLGRSIWRGVLSGILGGSRRR